MLEKVSTPPSEATWKPAKCSWKVHGVLKTSIRFQSCFRHTMISQNGYTLRHTVFRSDASCCMSCSKYNRRTTPNHAARLVSLRGLRVVWPLLQRELAVKHGQKSSNNIIFRFVRLMFMHSRAPQAARYARVTIGMSVCPTTRNYLSKDCLRVLHEYSSSPHRMSSPWPCAKKNVNELSLRSRAHVALCPADPSSLPGPLLSVT